MTEQQPEGRTPDDNRTADQSQTQQRPSIDDLIAPLDEAARQAIRDLIAARNDQTSRYRRRIAELEPKAAQYDAATEAAKSEQQKAAEREARFQRERDEAKASLLRFEVAASFPGLQASDAAFLTGSNRDELEASAQRLIARIQAAGDATTAPHMPAPDKGQGRDSNGQADPESWLRGALRHRS